ncbi:MAG: hemerythrin domain-containing protein [Gallionella sp.]|nr:hemerythrin domain-containing protein [Gallionella sp.]
MMVLIWRKHLSVGNATLDFEHKSLIGMVNSIEYAINTKNSHALLEITKLFKSCVDAHFANEARFAQAIKFPFAQHELEHQYLQKVLQQMMDRLSVKVGTWSEYVMDYDPQLLRDWLIGHITGEDMKMKPVLQSLPYDFKPV